MCNVVMNDQLKGVELYFVGKPEESVRNLLKENGYRWHSGKMCWYARQNEKTLKVAEVVKESEVKAETQEIKTKTNKKEVKPKTKEENSTLSLWDATRWTDLEVDNKQGTKEMAAEMRKHIRNRFPMCKFSITSDYSSIDFDIVASPFEKDSIYLKAIKEYCDKLISAYRYCTCYDPYGDYGSSYNFYDSRADIKWDYKQTEQNEEIKADMQNFDSELAEFQKSEEERKEKEYQEYLVKQEEEKKAYEIMEREQANQKEVINNSIKIKELPEENQYFVIGSQFANLNKNNTLDEYKEEVSKGEYSLENVKITKEVYFDSQEALNYFSNMLLHDFEWLQGTGGSFTDDKRFTSMTDYNIMPKEERESIIWNLYGVAVYCNNKLQFVIDAQGYSYARYVGLVDNAQIKKETPIKQFVNHEELEGLKSKAETLMDYSFEVITESELQKTWDSDSWNKYKELMKEKLKQNKFRLTKEIVRQIPEDQDNFKSAMYKLLTEVDGIQEQFRNADLKQGQKLTIFKISDFGSITTSRITLDKIEYIKYAQYDNNVKLTFTPEKKRKLYYNNYHGEILVYDGWLELPETVLHDVEVSNGFVITKSKYFSCDKKQYDEILEYFEGQGVRPIINTFKPTF